MTSSWEWKQYQRMLDNATDRLCVVDEEDNTKRNWSCCVCPWRDECENGSHTET